MATQQSPASSKREMMTDGARYVVAELVREPVKDAVREALDEEAAAVRSSERDADTASTDRSEPADRDDDGGGGSRIGLILMSVAAAVGAAYLVRKRRSDTEQSTWSEFEGEGARTEDGRTEHTPASTGTDTSRSGESTASAATDE